MCRRPVTGTTPELSPWNGFTQTKQRMPIPKRESSLSNMHRRSGCVLLTWGPCTSKKPSTPLAEMLQGSGTQPRLPPGQVPQLGPSSPWESLGVLSPRDGDTEAHGHWWQRSRPPTCPAHSSWLKGSPPGRDTHPPGDLSTRGAQFWTFTPVPHPSSGWQPDSQSCPD